MEGDAIKIFIPAALAFFIGVAITPALTGFLYRHRMWKKQAKAVAFDGKHAEIFERLHQERETKVPRMGGMIIWLSTLVTTAILFDLSLLFPDSFFEKLNFLSRSQTLLPLVALLGGGIIGLADDYLEVRGTGGYHAGGMSLRKRLLIVAAVGAISGFWFFTKLDVTGINIPGFGELALGIFIIPFFVIVLISLYSGGVIDGIDGLAGGIFATMYAAYAVIAFNQDQIDLAALSATIAGSILAFLWFNIPPARFYMSETGTMGLTIALGIIAFASDTLGEGSGVVALPIIAFPLVVTVLSNIIQIASKKLRGRKFFLVAPLHHHFEALGWPVAKITMRYWIIGVVMAILGTIVALLS